MIQLQDFSICLYLNSAYSRTAMTATAAYGGQGELFNADLGYLWEYGGLGDLYGGIGPVEVNRLATVGATISSSFASADSDDADLAAALKRHMYALGELKWPKDTLVMWPR